MSPATTPETAKAVRALVRAIRDANRSGDRPRALLLAARLERISRLFGLGIVVSRS